LIFKINDTQSDVEPLQSDSSQNLHMWSNILAFIRQVTKISSRHH